MPAFARTLFQRCRECAGFWFLLPCAPKRPQGIDQLHQEPFDDLARNSEWVHFHTHGNHDHGVDEVRERQLLGHWLKGKIDCYDVFVVRPLGAQSNHESCNLLACDNCRQTLAGMQHKDEIFIGNHWYFLSQLLNNIRLRITIEHCLENILLLVQQISYLHTVGINVELRRILGQKWRQMLLNHILDNFSQGIPLLLVADHTTGQNSLDKQFPLECRAILPATYLLYQSCHHRHSQLSRSEPTIVIAMEHRSQ
mmetsp:Transcript_24421/g.53721  ORF Transcript_24421/g.53721 Transcript_24421/m.53721 type:complete len:253 (-) Transcript_24421:482-1240(-)